MGEKDLPVLTIKYATEVVGVNWDKTTNVTMVLCADGTQYKLATTDQVPKVRAKVTHTVEISL